EPSSCMILAFQCLNRHEQPSSNASSAAENAWSRFQCLNRHEQPSSGSTRHKYAELAAMFQCLNRHEQPSSMIRPGFVGQIDRFNASIGTSNLQALQNLIERRLAFLVSMPQSARATFKRKCLVEYEF